MCQSNNSGVPYFFQYYLINPCDEIYFEIDCPDESNSSRLIISFNETPIGFLEICSSEEESL